MMQFCDTVAVIDRTRAMVATTVCSAIGTGSTEGAKENSGRGS